LNNDLKVNQEPDPGPLCQYMELNKLINESFTEKEIQMAIKRLKNDKVCGLDRIINEYIKCTVDLLMPIYTFKFDPVNRYCYN
jgi:hypothetical protein